MKTIKSFMTLNKTTRDIGPYHEGYWHALEDVLELIDEVNNEVHLQPLTELKARILGSDKKEEVIRWNMKLS